VTTEEFLGAKLRLTQAEMNSAILNRTRWEKLRDDCRLLTFLQQRSGAADFGSVQSDLTRISEGGLRVPDVDGPRRKAADCLKLWAADLQALD